VTVTGVVVTTAGKTGPSPTSSTASVALQNSGGEKRVVEGWVLGAVGLVMGLL